MKSYGKEEKLMSHQLLNLHNSGNPNTLSVTYNVFGGNPYGQMDYSFLLKTYSIRPIYCVNNLNS